MLHLLVESTVFDCSVRLGAEFANVHIAVQVYRGGNEPLQHGMNAGGTVPRWYEWARDSRPTFLMCGLGSSNQYSYDVRSAK
jgi:hypothetical protein